MRLSELGLKSQGPCRVQVKVNNALRLALGVDCVLLENFSRNSK
jgi:hypothetical protein